MKNVPRNKLLLCFRPVVDMDLMLESKAAAAAAINRPRNPYQALRYVDVHVETDEDSRPSSTTPNLDTRNSIMVRKKTFSQAIKAAFFDTILAKRVQDRKNMDKSEDRVSSCSSMWPPPSPPILTQESVEKHQQNDCNDGKLDGEGEMKGKQEGNDQGCSCPNKGIYFLLACLAMTIFCGKLWATIFTSTWLYFLLKLLRQQQEQASGVYGNVEAIKAGPANGFKRSRREGEL